MKKNNIVKDMVGIATGAVFVGATNVVIGDNLGSLSSPTKAVINVGFLSHSAKKLKLIN